MSELNLPQGYRWSGHHCGIKSDSAKPDYSLIVSDRNAICVGVYTQNLVAAASVKWCRARTPNRTCRAIVSNSGNANACTGERGDRDTLKMAEDVAVELGLDGSQIMVMSTGVIGTYLPMDKIASAAAVAVQQLSSSTESFLNSARALLTTDNGEKIAHRQLATSQGVVTILAVAKGAAMIGPNMATMLACVMTDAALQDDVAQKMLKDAADKSFNCISVEGHTSTNDTLLLISNGAAAEDELTGDDLSIFELELRSVLIELAKKIPSDGEGATHLIEICVVGAASDEDAKKIATVVGGSNLVKTCVAGGDPNWGRIVSAVGYATVSFDVRSLKLHINGTLLFENEEPVDFDTRIVATCMRDSFTTLIELDLGAGTGTATIWTSDLTCDYVRFNSEYHT